MFQLFSRCNFLCRPHIFCYSTLFEYKSTIFKSKKLTFLCPEELDHIYVDEMKKRVMECTVNCFPKNKYIKIILVDKAKFLRTINFKVVPDQKIIIADLNFGLLKKNIRPTSYF